MVFYCSSWSQHIEMYAKNYIHLAGLDYTNKSNQSLRVTSISRMYKASVPEKIIMERSGHLSKDGV